MLLSTRLSPTYKLILIALVAISAVLLLEPWRADRLDKLSQYVRPSRKPTAPFDVDATCQAYGFPTWSLPDRKVYDLVLLYNELDWLEVRLHTLDPSVDYFVVVETTTTFTGLKKELYLENSWDRFKKFHHKIIHYVITEEEMKTVESELGWDHERYQRNAMLKSVFPTLVGTPREASKGDVLVVSDLDEIPRPEVVEMLKRCQFPARTTMQSNFYYYSYQWRHEGGGGYWPHPQATIYGGSVDTTISPEALRGGGTDEDSNAVGAKMGTGDDHKYLKSLDDAAWHCSSCFEKIVDVQDKIRGFSHVEFNTEENLDPKHIIHRFQRGIDMFDRADQKYNYVFVNDAPAYVREQYAKHGRFRYLFDRTAPDAGFSDAAALLGEELGS